MTVTVGDELPSIEIPITATLIVGGAIASRDFQDVHHDSARAKERGTPDIFMNIMTTNGLVTRFVTDWAGPDAVVRGVSFRLGVPNYPGDVMRLEGRVVSTDHDVATVEVVGRNQLGDHVSGTVEVSIP
jgi:hypothetical protein